MNNKDTDVAVISEPPANKRGGMWFLSTDGKAAVCVKNMNKAIEIISQGEGRIGVKIGKKLIIYSVYYSPNKVKKAFKEFWDKLTKEIWGLTKTGRNEIIIAGDLNAKSALWNGGRGSGNKRGELIVEEMGTLGLICCNVGGKPTCKKAAGSSVVDITLATAEIAGNIREWKVLEEETMSDHEYIAYTIKWAKAEKAAEKQEKGWMVEKLDKKKARVAISRFKQVDLDGSLGENIKDFEDEVRKICKEAMPKRKEKRKKNCYWWKAEIGEIRLKCKKMKRKLGKMRKGTSGERRGKMELEEKYKQERRNLKTAIFSAKKEAWDSALKAVDENVWGLAFKIAREKFKKQYLPMDKEEVKSAIKELFPVGEGLGEIQEKGMGGEDIRPVGVEELKMLGRKLKNKKRPGPDGIPNEILKLIIDEKPEEIIKILNKCLKYRDFPEAWKKCTVALIPKGTESDAANNSNNCSEKKKYRPICLLNNMGKLLEKVIDNRLQEQIEEKIDKKQFGFRRGVGTVDAVEEAKKIIKGGINRKNYVIGVSLDIKNAFNSVNWTNIIANMEEMGVSDAIRDIIKSYLYNRKAEILVEGERIEWEIKRGVPQGSVLGPTLWNIVYNNIIRGNEGEGTVLCYADDTLYLEEGDNLGDLITNAERRIGEIVGRIENLGLEVASEKTEVVIFTRKRYKYGEKREIKIKNRIVKAKGNLKYLGIILDEKLLFRSHMQEAYVKAMKVMNRLGMLLGNVKGPSQDKRKLLTSVGLAIFTYGAPIWADSIEKGENKKMIEKISRISALRIAAAYKTIATEAAEVIACSPPVELLIKMRETNYNKLKNLNLEGLDRKIREKLRKGIKKEGNKEMVEKWQTKWNKETGKANWTKSLIRNIEMWKNKKYGTNYFLTQFLSGHGAFNQYLYKFKKRNSPLCSTCKVIENAEHVIMKCRRWEQERGDLVKGDNGEIVNPRKLVELAIRNKEKWRRLTEAVDRILGTKEAEEREMGY
ncbi:Putative 115 kDa protein in type-1 retrotransposable element R1DM [Anthophora retusa]